jgi:DNA-binding response OmpR family regulator
MKDSAPNEGKRRARLLIVDDEARLRTALRELLKLRGYHVGEAGSGPEALELLRHTSYDLMVLDMNMPKMDGVEAMRRARQVQPDLLIVVLTAHASLDSAIAAVRASAADYLLKPFEIEDLDAVISKALQERAQQMQRQKLLNVIGSALDELRESAEAPQPPEAVPLELAPPEALELSPKRVLHCAPLILDLQKRTVLVEEDPPRTVELTESEASMLATLMQHPDQVLPYVQLAQAAVNSESDDGYALDEWDAKSIVRPCIHRLRRKIETAPEQPSLICTVRGRGYFYSPA